MVIIDENLDNFQKFTAEFMGTKKNIYNLIKCSMNRCTEIYFLEVTVFANGLGDWGLIPGRVIPRTQKMVLDATLLNTQHYKVRIKGKVEQSREKSSALPYTLV